MIPLMKNRFVALVISSGICLVSSCASNEPVEEEKVEEVRLDKMVARVASVNEAAEYVLIQRYGRLVIPDDSILYTLDSIAGDVNKAASIKVTGEKLGQFLAADIISGKLTIGDAVYLRIFDKNEDFDN